MSKFGTEYNVEKKYGPAGSTRCFSGKVSLPFPMKLSWDKSKIITRFNCHENFALSAQRVFENIFKAYSKEEIEKHGFNVFGGCFNNRNKRGGVTKSMHAYGLAVDIDPERNTYKSNSNTAYLARPECLKFWECWENEGWVSLGRKHNYDWMHVQALDTIK